MVCLISELFVAWLNYGNLIGLISVFVFCRKKKNYRLIFLSSSLHFRLGLPFWWSVFCSCLSDMFVFHCCPSCLSSILVLHVRLTLWSTMFVSHVCLPLLAFMLLIRFSTPRVLLMLAFNFCHPFVSVIFPIHVRLFGLSTMLCLLSHSSFQPIVRTGPLRMCTSIPTNQPILMIPQVMGVCACPLIRTGDLSIWCLTHQQLCQSDNRENRWKSYSFCLLKCSCTFLY